MIGVILRGSIFGILKGVKRWPSIAPGLKLREIGDGSTIAGLRVKGLRFNVDCDHLFFVAKIIFKIGSYLRARTTRKQLPLSGFGFQRQLLEVGTGSCESQNSGTCQLLA